MANAIFLGETDFQGTPAKAYRLLGKGYKYIFVLEDGRTETIVL